MDVQEYEDQIYQALMDSESSSSSSFSDPEDRPDPVPGEEEPKPASPTGPPPEAVSIPRYFIDASALKKKSIKCHFCRQEGHVFRDCKAKDIRCLLCRADHEPTRCPLAQICFSCYRRGHTKRVRKTY